MILTLEHSGKMILTLEHSRALWERILTLTTLSQKDFCWCLEVNPDSDAVSNVSTFTNYMTHYDTSDIKITTWITALIAHIQRSPHTARTAKVFDLGHFENESTYSIDHFSALTNPHCADRQKLVQKLVENYWLSAWVFWVIDIIDMMYIHILRHISWPKAKGAH